MIATENLLIFHLFLLIQLAGFLDENVYSIK